jgi:hypothetical protein
LAGVVVDVSLRLLREVGGQVLGRDLQLLRVKWKPAKIGGVDTVVARNVEKY